MSINILSLEMAEAFDLEAGYHQFRAEDGELYGSFEVFWSLGCPDDGLNPGWFWWPCFPGCLPDSDEIPTGPFASSSLARLDADQT
jgi:hypothetical protein